jgi:hypothetical protein
MHRTKMPIDGKVIERGASMKQFSASRTRNPLTVAGDIDAVLVNLSPDTVCIARAGDDTKSAVMDSNLRPVRKAIQKAFNMVVYGRPTNTFLDRQKD